MYGFIKDVTFQKKPHINNTKKDFFIQLGKRSPDSYIFSFNRCVIKKTEASIRYFF